MLTKNLTFFKSMITMFVVIMVIGITGGCTPEASKPVVAAPSSDDGTKIQSISIMPSAVLSVSPSLSKQVSSPSMMSSASTFMNLMKSMAEGSRAEGDILNPDAMTQYFMPLFTGLQEPAKDSFTGGTSSNWVGYYLGYPILLQAIDKTADNTNDLLKTVLQFNYYQDVNVNKKIDTAGELGQVKDTLIAQVKVGIKDKESGNWDLYQYVSNPFNKDQQFEMKAMGIYGRGVYSGNGSFKATDGDYAGSAKVNWSMDSEGVKYINVTNGKIIYTGSNTNNYFNVNSLSLAIVIQADGSSTVTESASIEKVEKSGVVITTTKSTTTKNSKTGQPTDVAYSITISTRELDGTIKTKNLSGSKKIIVETTLADGAIISVTNMDSNATQQDMVYYDDNGNAIANEGIVTVYAKNAPIGTANNTMKVWIYKTTDIDFSANPKPKAGKQPVAFGTGPISTALTAKITTDKKIITGNYFVMVVIDPLNDTMSPGTSGSDDYICFLPSQYINGDTTVNVGKSENASLFRKGGQDSREKRPLEIDFKKYQVESGALSTNSPTSIDVALIRGKTAYLTVTQETTYGENFISPLASKVFTIPNDIDANSIYKSSVYIDGFIDFTDSRLFKIRMYIDMNSDGKIDTGDYFTYSSAEGGFYQIADYKDLIDSEMMVTKRGIQIKGFFKPTAEIINTSSANYSNYSWDGVVPSNLPEIVSPHYDANSQVIATGKIDFTKVNKSDADVWFAVLLPYNGHVVQMSEPIAICLVDGNGKYSFSKFATMIMIGESGNPTYYQIIGVGFKDFNINIDKFRQLYSDDYLVSTSSKKLANFAYQDGIFRNVWEKNFFQEVEPNSTANLTLEYSETMGDNLVRLSKVTNNELSSDGDESNGFDVIVSFDFQLTGINPINVPNTPLFITVSESTDNGWNFLAQQEVYLAEEAGVYSMAPVTFNKALNMKLYEINAFMDLWDPTSNSVRSLEFTFYHSFIEGMSPFNVIGTLVEVKNTTYDPAKTNNIDFNITLASLADYTDDVGALVDGRTMYVEFFYVDNGVEKTYMTSSVLDSESINKMGSGSISGVKIWNIPQNFYKYRAFIDMDGKNPGGIDTPAIPEPDKFPFDCSGLMPKPSAGDILFITDDSTNIDLQWYGDTETIPIHLKNWTK